MTLADGFLPLVAVPLIALAAHRMRAVDFGGMLSGLCLGALVASGLGWAGIAMLGTMLLLGTLTSRRGARNRDWIQVASNGVVAAAAGGAALGGASWGAAAAAGALAAALSDTVSGELGSRLAARPRRLLFGPVVKPGTDGGMSLPGTLLGLLAAPLVPLAGAVFDARGIVLLGLAGFCGNLFDSFSGWAIQPHLGRRGNDWTNLAATVSGAAVGLLLLGV